jgi:hypothetical protein
MSGIKNKEYLQRRRKISRKKTSNKYGLRIKESSRSKFGRVLFSATRKLFKAHRMRLKILAEEMDRI